MPKPKYEVIIYWSDDDQSFIAEVPELPGRAADGKTHRDALHNVEGIIMEWLETARDLGRPIPKPKGRLVFARIGASGSTYCSWSRQSEVSMKAKRKFMVVIERDEDGNYLASFPALHGCHTQAKNEEPRYIDEANSGGH